MHLDHSTMPGLMRTVVTGGAGYIGSVVAKQLLAAGHDVVVLDDLSRGHAAAVPSGAAHADVSLLDGDALAAPLEGVDAVLHFAALARVAESVEHPERYWRNNVAGTLNLLDAMRAAGIRRLVFSSTCATYGEPETVPIPEDEPTAPVNAYGASKLAVDLMIRDECRAHGLAAASLRYFNVAGASGELGEDHEPETHLIPLILHAAAAGARERISVFGTDYPTRDGTAVRDYIHIEDLGEAHLLALDRLVAGEHRVYNLGTGDGYTVREVIEAARRVTGREIPVRDEGRRAGDPPELVAANARARAELGWEPRRGLDEMIGDAWAWQQAYPQGYRD
jgi:UDP-glucose 4-epimerase